MELREMMSKTGMQIVGVVRSINTYVSKENKSYYSVDLDIAGCRQPINIALPESYDKSKLVECDLTKIALVVVPSFDKKNIKLQAI